jgi:hypothetical protein
MRFLPVSAFYGAGCIAKLKRHNWLIVQSQVPESRSSLLWIKLSSLTNPGTRLLAGCKVCLACHSPL